MTTTNRFNSYGWALFAVPADDSMHGMIGPRNVFYNCDTSSFRGGVYLGGPNLGWRIVYNRFDVKKGPGILERFGGTDNIFAGNVFILRDKSVPAVYLESLDSSGDRISGNRIYGGNGKIAVGPGVPNAVLKENQTYALTEKTEIPAVKAPAPSLWKWQKQTYGSRK